MGALNVDKASGVPNAAAHWVELGAVARMEQGVVAHFLAHTRAIVALQWDASGSLLLTADKPGHNFHLFRIVAHPLGSAFAAVHHLYTLYRGDTPGSVQDVAFSPDRKDKI